MAGVAFLLVTFLWPHKEKSLAQARRAGEISSRAEPSCSMVRSHIKEFPAGSGPEPSPWKGNLLRCNALRLLHPTVFHYVAKPRHHIQFANVRIRCAIRTYDSITPGDYGFPHPDPLPRGEGTKTLGVATSRE